MSHYSHENKRSVIYINITKLKPFNCKYYLPKTLLSESACIGYCQMGDDDLSLRYCKCVDCENYEKRGE